MMTGEGSLVVGAVGAETIQAEAKREAVHEALRPLYRRAPNVLVVNNLKVGVEVANAAGEHAAAAGWSQHVPTVRDFRKQACVAYIAAVPEPAEFILRWGRLSGRVPAESSKNAQVMAARHLTRCARLRCARIV